jgi:hexosaminidase
MHLMKGAFSRFILSFCFLLFAFITSFGQLKLIPSPSKVLMASGTCVLGPSLNPMRGGKMMAYKEWLQLPAVKNIKLSIFDIAVSESNFDPTTRDFLAYLEPLDFDAYKITITKDNISFRNSVNTTSPLQTLYQLCQNYGAALPCCTILDTPKYRYRGMHLDVCRHFFTVEEVKAYLSLMARYKFNVFHWHLTDDQGWRIAIKKYPELCIKGGTRPRTIIGRQRSNDGAANDFDNVTEQGYYTQEQIKEVIEYAQSLDIAVIPEIEMPGHSKAAIAAYPWLGCTGEACTVGDRWGVFDEVYCPGKDSTLLFMADVLNEVCDLFPTAYIHIGGDEVVYNNWKKCPHCAKRMQAEGFEKAEQLQAYFMRRIQKEVLAPRNRRIFGWDELVDDGLEQSAVIMSWRGEAGGIIAANRGHDVVMTPASHCYFDHAYSRSNTEPLSIGGNTPLQKVLAYRPTPAEIEVNQAMHVLGAQANLWTEYIPDTAQLFYMALPRMQALSEVLWYGKPVSYNAFYKKLGTEYGNLDAMHYNYRLQEPLGFSADSLELNTIPNYKLTALDNKSKIEYSLNENGTDAKQYRGEDLLPMLKKARAQFLFVRVHRNGKSSVWYRQLFKS